MNLDRLRLVFGGLHPDRLRSLVEDLGGEAAVLAAIRSGKVPVGPAARDEMMVPAVRRLAELRRSAIAYVDRDDPGFPSHLAALPDTPPGLFVRGTLGADKGVAVVGTRRCTSYGRRLAGAYGRAIARAGWPLVSGLARGIDGAAHRGTVDGRGVGVAVLGSGVDVLYPGEHAGLAADLIAHGGAVVSEYPPGAAPLAWRFPPRNRIISGLSAAVVVVEAGVKGGALITARRALDQGVAVFAVPGDVHRDSSRGANLLIRDGAHPVLDPDDLVEELALVLGPPPGAATASGDAGDDPVLRAVAERGELSVDDLSQGLGEPIAAVLTRIGVLEAQGRVRFDGITLRANGH